MPRRLRAKRQRRKEHGKRKQTLGGVFLGHGHDRPSRADDKATGGTLREIAPRQAYTAADLDWNDRRSRSSVEMDDPAARPALKGERLDIAAHDVIFIGYPIWWDQAPRVINTFIESHDLRGKTLVPFATSGGSGIGNSVKELRKAYPELDWRDGKLLNGASRAAIRRRGNAEPRKASAEKVRRDAARHVSTLCARNAIRRAHFPRPLFRAFSAK